MKIHKQKYFSFLWFVIFFSQLFFLRIVSAKEVVPRARFPVRIVPAFKHAFKKPVFMAPVPGGHKTNRVAILEKHGRLLFVEKNSLGKTIVKTAIDFRSRTLTQGLEEGALGFAFDPNFLHSKRVYIYYSGYPKRRTVLSRFTFKAYSAKISLEEPLQFSTREEKLLSIYQPFANHNGGMLQFGSDGTLFIGVGDGGSAGDPRGYAQNLNSHLGKILRINVSRARGYSIPKDNPFAHEKNCPAFFCKPEIFAWGLRNPWRFSVIGKTLIVGDVGQNLYEKLAIVNAGENHGWNHMEGDSCYKKYPKCDRRKYSRPFLVYDHSEGISILGGLIYKGKKNPKLFGKYIFGDSLFGKVWSYDIEWGKTGLKPARKKKRLLYQAPFLISSFGTDHFSEIYLLDLNGGYVYALWPISKQGQRLSQ